MKERGREGCVGRARKNKENRGLEKKGKGRQKEGGGRGVSRVKGNE